MVHQRPGRCHPFGERGKVGVVLQRIAGRHQQPDGIELQPLQRLQRHQPMPLMRRIEAAAEQPDAHAGAAAMRQRRDVDRRRVARPASAGGLAQRAMATTREQVADSHHGRTWPLPRTRYLKLVSCSTPTGPRACILPVGDADLAAKAELAAIGELGRGVVQQDGGIDLVEERAPPTPASSVMIASVWCEGIAVDMGDRRRRHPSTTFTAMMASTYSVCQSASVAGIGAGNHRARPSRRRGFRSRVAISASMTGRRCVATASLWTSSVSVAPQTPVRRILALTRDRRPPCRARPTCR